MDYAQALAAYQGGGTVGVLRTHLLAKVWPNAQPPKLFISQDQTLAQGLVRASYNADSYAITVRHGARTAAKDILDNVLFEVGNALNPKLGQAHRLPKSEPVDNVGAATGAAEYDSLKAYIGDLAVIFAGGAPAGFPGLLGGNADLPTQARDAIKTWVARYVPIYTRYRVNAQVMPATVPLVNLLPLPAVAPAVPPGAAAAPLPAEQAAIIEFCSTVHNPGATGEQFYLARLTTRQSYAYERPRNWIANQLKNYFGGIPTLVAPAAAGNLLSNAIYKPFRDAWSDADPRYRCYLFAKLTSDLAAAYPGTIPAHFQFDPLTAGVALDEAARGIASWYDDPIAINYKKVLPIKRWLASDQALLNAVNHLLGNQSTPKAVDLSLIK